MLKINAILLEQFLIRINLEYFENYLNKIKKTIKWVVKLLWALSILILIANPLNNWIDLKRSTKEKANLKR